MFGFIRIFQSADETRVYEATTGHSTEASEETLIQRKKENC